MQFCAKNVVFTLKEHWFPLCAKHYRGQSTENKQVLCYHEVFTDIYF